MADTGAPHFIPYVEPTDLVRDYPAADEAQAEAIAAGLSAAGNAFDDSVTITATDATFSVPALGSPIVKVTVIGGGGGGGFSLGTVQTTGGAGGTTTFDAGAGKVVSATGGAGGTRRVNNFGGEKLATTLGFASWNGGFTSGRGGGEGTEKTGTAGGGGKVIVGYVDLTGVSTVDITVGAGGAGAVSNTGASFSGGDGGRGEVILEFKAA